MDYGTGHETSFALFLLCLSLIRVFNPEPQIERELVLTIFVRYLRLCWKLQDVYRLEPAGSHGVWGLDDFCFLPYIFGSAQLRGWCLTLTFLVYTTVVAYLDTRPGGHPRIGRHSPTPVADEPVLHGHLSHL